MKGGFSGKVAAGGYYRIFGGKMVSLQYGKPFAAAFVPAVRRAALRPHPSGALEAGLRGGHRRGQGRSGRHRGEPRGAGLRQHGRGARVCRRRAGPRERALLQPARSRERRRHAAARGGNLPAADRIRTLYFSERNPFLAHPDRLRRPRCAPARPRPAQTTGGELQRLHAQRCPAQSGGQEDLCFAGGGARPAGAQIR